MSISGIIIIICTALCWVGTFLPLNNSKHWLVRSQTYLRWHYSLLLILLIGITILLQPFQTSTFIFVLILQWSAVGFGLITIYPFTKFAPKTIEDSKSSNDKLISLLISNVYQDNKNHSLLIERIKENNPDIIFLVETNDRWYESLQQIEKDYKYIHKALRENTYGMVLYSKLPIENPRTFYFQSVETPAISLSLHVNETKIEILGIHPKPPIITEEPTSLHRDIEIIKAADFIQRDTKNADVQILCGDLNDTAWGSATAYMKNITGLLDPRQGRGFYATFPVYFPIKIPIDHVFSSENVTLQEFRVLNKIGSDHLPIFVSFSKRNL